MTGAELLEHLKGSLVIPTLMVLLYVHRVIRPEFVQVRSFGVYLLAIARAFVLAHGVTAEQIEAQVIPADKAIPGVPEVTEVAGAAVGNLMSLAKTSTGSMTLMPAIAPPSANGKP